jgi:hypothetical protein
MLQQEDQQPPKIHEGDCPQRPNGYDGDNSTAIVAALVRPLLMMRVQAKPVAILDRHALRRASGVPTVSLLVGPIGVGGRLWRRWASAYGRNVVTTETRSFPYEEWIRCVAAQIDLPASAITRLAARADRPVEELQGVWSTITPADRVHFWDTLAPEVDDALLRPLAELAVSGGSPEAVVDLLSKRIEQGLPHLVRLAPTATWPAVLLLAESADGLSGLGQAAVRWVMQAPVVPVAIAAPSIVWRDYLESAPESRVKSLLNEGEILVEAFDPTTAARTLHEAGADRDAIATIAAYGADADLVESAIELVQATTQAASIEAEDDRARSAAERFLFLFLESLPETAGRFALNATLDFRFGPRAAEVDLLCRSGRLAVEVDGYFHFDSLERYRRDRAKDWELQRRGYLVLRFHAEDVIPHLETIRDRILEALSLTFPGEQA